MINKRLMTLLEGNLSPIKKTVFFQWLGLIANIIFNVAIAYALSTAYKQQLTLAKLSGVVAVIAVMIGLRFYWSQKATMAGHSASLGIKKTLREKIYNKILELGMHYTDFFPTSKVVQMSMEGVEQLEIYFSKYLPQLFYSLLAPVTLFILFSLISFKTALLLLICVPLIPMSIVAVQKFAKKLLSRYWGSYMQLGDSFLENLRGLTTLKAYQADERKTKQMDEEAETFRKVTMKVLTMQLNSISVMDLIAFGGAALGIILAIFEFRSGHISLMGMLLIILLSSEFFIPLRLLGSFFHIAMNGMSASDNIFKILDHPLDIEGELELCPEEDIEIKADYVSFGYNEETEVLKNLSFTIPSHSFVSFAGISGSGKSTIANILAGHHQHYQGSIQLNGKELANINQKHLMACITVVNNDGYLFAGDITYNLQMGNTAITQEQMWEALREVKLDCFIRDQGGLSMPVLEKGSNLSGGQRQRLILARALLKDSPIYIFDEATSNIDVESENAIIKVIENLRKNKTVIMISHRLDNAVHADQIYMLKEGRIVEQDTHAGLYQLNGEYARVYKQQEALLNVLGKETAYE